MMNRTASLVVIGILVAAVAAGAFLLMGSSQTQVCKDAMMKEPAKEQIMEKEPAQEQSMVKDLFILKSVDGGEISLAQLQQSGKPVLVYFFATWCPTCERDLRSLNSVYEKYQGKVEVVVIGFDPTENAEQIRQYRQGRGYTWQFAEYNKDALLHFKIVTQSTKIGIDAKGNEIFRDGYSVLSESDWTARLDKLLA